MAPKRRTVSADERPTVDEVRMAVQHLLELAAGFEGRGLDLGCSASSEADDLRTLRDVVRLLNEHRTRQRASQADGVHVRLVERAGHAYRHAIDARMSEGQLTAHLAKTVHVLGHVPDEADQRVLTIPVALPVGQKTERRRTISDLGGPVEAAKDRVGLLMDRAGRVLADRLSRKEGLPWARTCFGRYAPKSLVQAYADELLPGGVDPDRLGDEGLTALRTIDEREGRAIDLFNEQLFCRSFATRGGYLQLLLDETPDMRGPASERYRLGFWELWLDCSGAAGESGLAFTANLDDVTVPREYAARGVTSRDVAELSQFCFVGLSLVLDRVAYRRRELALAPEGDMQPSEMAALLPSVETLACRLYLAAPSPRVPKGPAKCLRVQTLSK